MRAWMRTRWIRAGFPVAVAVAAAFAVGPAMSAEQLAVPAMKVNPQQQQRQAPDPNDYRIGPEDMVDVVVWNNTTISRTVPVRPDGRISLPLLNDVQAAGLTAAQLRDELTRRLADYMSKPEVSVIVSEVHSRKVSVIGQVRKPGRFELKSHATVLDLLAEAEGLNEFASRSKIFVLRASSGGSKRLRFNYRNATNGGSQENFLLEPGDIVVVP